LENCYPSRAALAREGPMQRRAVPQDSLDEFFAIAEAYYDHRSRTTSHQTH
jgi:hypothetical protein